ncbi:MAG: WD40/YVTN/BNR-like repeat-containing protein, partial [Steroidobacteraceae bacterium]
NDAGHSWQGIGLADSQQIGRILVDPTNPDVVLVAALGHPYGANEMRGVFRSADGGGSWRRTLYKNADTGAIDLAMEPGQPNLVYAALWQTRRPPWNVYPPASGPGGGLYESHDGGQSWAPLSGHGLPDQPGRIGIAVSPAKPQRVFALIDAVQGGLYRSDDAGATWTRVSDDHRIWKRGWYFGGVTADPVNADVVYICNTALYRSADGGKTFIPVKGAPGGDDYHQLWIDPHDPQRRILGVDQGAVVTLDGGASWSSWLNQPTGQFYHVITDNRFPYWVYGAQQDSGAAGIPSRTDNIDGINLTEFRETATGGESDNIAPDPHDPQIIFGGRVDKLDLRTGQRQSVAPTLAYPGLYRGTWTLPLVFGKPGIGKPGTDKPGTDALYFGNQRIFRTTDRGRHWDVISPDLTRENPATPAGLDAATVGDNEGAGPRRGVVYAIGPSQLDARLIWAGTDDGLLWRTRDGGSHWQNVTPAALSAWSKIGIVEPSHFDADSAYLAVDRHRLDDPRPYVYRTHDGGASWVLIVGGIADGGTVNAVREDPAHRGLLYCGTERGVYVSFDDGAHWQALQQNLPRTSVRDLQVHGDDVVIATHGRGFWIMDDVAPLRALADELGGSGSHAGARLFPPATAYRVRPTGFIGSPMPKDEAMGANPPPGAYIDYALDAPASGAVTLTIADARGAAVRSFSSSDERPKPDLAKLEIAPEWIVPPQPLASGAGAHRFVWDLHYAPPRPALAADDPSESETGVWAPPGRYSIELEVGGKHYRESLTVAPDPRIRLPADAYARQFALAREIEDARVQTAAALAEAGRTRSAIAERGKNAGAAAAAALAAADRQLLAISDLATEQPSPDAIGRAPGTIHGLRYLEAAFHNLARAVDDSDTAPTRDAVQGYARHRALLDAALASWARFKTLDLPRLNARLQSDGAAPIAP